LLDRILPDTIRGSISVRSVSVRASFGYWELSIAKTSAALRLGSIKSKIVAFALLATLIPALSTAVVSYLQNRRALTEKLNEELAGASSQTAREVDLWLAQRFFDVGVSSASFEVSENMGRLVGAGRRSAATLQAVARLKDYLGSVQERLLDFEELLVLDPTGTVVATGGEEAGEVSLPDGWLETVRRHQRFLGEPYWDSVVGKATVMMAVPLEASGTFLGVLIAKVNFDAANATLGHFAPGDSGEVYLLTAGGTLITSSRASSPEIMGTTLDPQSLIALEEAERAAIEYSDYEGRAAVGALDRVPRSSWAVVAQLPQSEAYAQMARLRNVTVILVFGLLIVVSIIAYALGLLIVRPLGRLTRGAARVAGGDLSVDLPVISGGEVGYLTEVFNDMVARLRAGREELDAASEALQKKNEELGRLSVTDGLTGLFNRRHLMETLVAEQRRAQRSKRPFSLLMLDVDHFKKFNDKFGHLAGDEVLLSVSGIIRKCARNVDFPARYGGEEFCVIVSESDMGGAVELAERIRTELEAVKFEGQKITVSIGAAEFPIDGETVDDVIATADAALYRAKRGGRNRVARATRKRSSKATKES
jgi:diguanylate cyclase (GGDEF)-like protein